MPQTKPSPWDEFPVTPEGSAAAADIDGGGDWSSFAPATGEADSSSIVPNSSAGRSNQAAPASPAASAPTAPALADLPQVVTFGDGAGGDPDRPNLSMKPDQEEHLRMLAASTRGTPDQVADAMVRYVLSTGYPLNVDAARPGYRHVVEKARSGVRIGPIEYGRPQPLTDPNEGQAIIAGAASDIPGANKIEALIDSASVALGLGGQGKPNQSFGNNYRGTLDRIEATDQAAYENHPGYYVGGAVAGGAMVPSGSESAAYRAAIAAGRDALSAGKTADEARSLMTVAARRAAGNRMAAEGAAYGGALGAGNSDSVPDALRNGVEGALLGGVAGKSMGEAGRFLPGATSANSEGRDVMEAATRLKIDPLAADVAGPFTRLATSAFAQTMAGGKPIIDASRRMLDQAQSARGRIAETIGAVLNPEAAGERARAGAQAYIASSRATKNGMYELAEKASAGVKVPPTKAVAALDRNIAELREVPGGAPALERLSGLRDALASGDVTVSGMKNMRSVLREQFMQDGLRGSDTERRVMQVLDAADQDVSDGLTLAGKAPAAMMYKKAAAFARDRIQTIDNVLTPIIGKDGTKSGEKIATSLRADLQGNNARAVKFLATLPPEAKDDVRASIVGGLGRATPGTQNASGDAFSLSRFLTHYNEIGETAKRAYFGAEGRAALNDLAKVAEGSKAAAKYANHSNTAGGLANIGTAATGFIGFPILLKVLATQYGAGRLLASPRVARWLARAGKTSLSPQSYIERLGRIARAEPAIASNIHDLQQRLTAAMESTPQAAAADESGNRPGVADGDYGQSNPYDNGAYPPAANDAAAYSAPAYDPASDPSLSMGADDGSGDNYADGLSR